jgi:hypothetical protein
MISRIHGSLRTNPNEGLTIDGILDWIRDHQPTLPAAWFENGPEGYTNHVETTIEEEQAYGLGVCGWNLAARQSGTRGTERGGDYRSSRGKTDVHKICVGPLFGGGANV